MMRRILLAMLAFVAPANAERLQFDHRLYPPLKQVLDSGDTNMVAFDSSNPARPVDLIAIRGKSAKDWTEALELMSIVRPKTIAGATAWLEALKAESLAKCPGTFNVLAKDDISVTFERLSPNCPEERAQFGLYRLVAGKKSWFRLAVLAKDGLSPAAREQWLTLLASAHLR